MEDIKEDTEMFSSAYTACEPEHKVEWLTGRSHDLIREGGRCERSKFGVVR